MQKICFNCEVLKDTSNFYKRSLSSDGLDYYCKECRNTKSRDSHVFKEKSCSVDDCTKPNYSQNMCRLHYERVRRNGHTNRKIKVSSTEPYRLKEIRYRYSIDIDWYLSKVNGPCDICGEKPYDNALHIDHDHSCCGNVGSCGQCVRGLVCASCNTHLRHWDKGTIRQANHLMEQVKAYIERYQQRSMVK